MPQEAEEDMGLTMPQLESPGALATDWGVAGAKAADSPGASAADITPQEAVDPMACVPTPPTSHSTSVSKASVESRGSVDDVGMIGDPGGVAVRVSSSSSGTGTFAQRPSSAISQ